MTFNHALSPDALQRQFETSLRAFCSWSLEKNEHGQYVDSNTAYAWHEFLRINVQGNAAEVAQEAVTV